MVAASELNWIFGGRLSFSGDLDIEMGPGTLLCVNMISCNTKI